MPVQIPYLDDPRDPDVGMPLQVPFLSHAMAPQIPQMDMGTAPPADSLAHIGDETPLGRFAQPILPPVTLGPAAAQTHPPTGVETQRDKTEKDLEHLQFQDKDPWGSADNHPGKLGGFLHGLASFGNVAGAILAPGIERAIPGSMLNRQSREQGDLKNLETLSNDASQEGEQDAAAGKNREETAEMPGKDVSELALQRSQAGNLDAEAAEHNRLKPDPDRAKTITTDKGVMQWNPATSKYDIPAGGNPKEQNPQQQTFDSLIKGGMTPVEAYEKIREKPGGTTINEGTWTLAEDKDGKPILFNSKTGGTRDDTSGMQKAGTQAKKDAANAPVEAALGYANDYVKNGVFTGAGDEALQEKFFELAKPSTGFRMSQPQIDMLQNARGWMSSWAAHARHATSGTWFSPQQRQEIVNTMNELHDAKLAAAKGSGGEGGGGGPRKGDVVDGFEFLGGDPAQQTSWKKAGK